MNLMIQVKMKENFVYLLTIAKMDSNAGIECVKLRSEKKEMTAMSMRIVKLTYSA